MDNRYWQLGVAKVKSTESASAAHHIDLHGDHKAPQPKKPCAYNQTNCRPLYFKFLSDIFRPFHTALGLGGGLKLNLPAAKADLPYVAWLKSATRPRFPWEIPNSEIGVGKCIGRGGMRKFIHIYLYTFTKVTLEY